MKQILFRQEKGVRLIKFIQIKRIIFIQRALRSQVLWKSRTQQQQTSDSLRCTSLLSVLVDSMDIVFVVLRAFVDETTGCITKVNIINFGSFLEFFHGKLRETNQLS